MEKTKPTDQMIKTVIETLADTTIITKNLISAVAERLTNDKWTVFDINFKGNAVPFESQKKRIHIKRDGDAGYLYGIKGYCGEPEELVSEQELGDILYDYYMKNGMSKEWDFKFVVVSELHYYGIDVLPTYLDKDEYVRECRFRDKMMAEYGCD